MKEGKQKRRKRIEIKLQGSSLVRGLHKLPQMPPKNPTTKKAAYDARACVECHPVCAHGYQLTAEEVASAKVSGTRIASDCPACTASTDPKAWNAFLNEAGFSMFRGMNIAELYIPTCRGGVHALGQGKCLAYAGGSRKLDDIDAQSSSARDDMYARHKKPEGHGPRGGQDEENEE